MPLQDESSSKHTIIKGWCHLLLKVPWVSFGGWTVLGGDNMQYHPSFVWLNEGMTPGIYTRIFLIGTAGLSTFQPTYVRKGICSPMSYRSPVMWMSHAFISITCNTCWSPVCRLHTANCQHTRTSVPACPTQNLIFADLRPRNDLLRVTNKIHWWPSWISLVHFVLVQWLWVKTSKYREDNDVAARPVDQWKRSSEVPNTTNEAAVKGRGCGSDNDCLSGVCLVCHIGCFEILSGFSSAQGPITVPRGATLEA